MAREKWPGLGPHCSMRSNVEARQERRRFIGDHVTGWLVPEQGNLYHMEQIVSRVSSIISECLQAPDTQDVAQLDVWSFNLRSCSDELGQFVSSEVVSNGPRTLSQDQLSKLVDLN